MFGKEFLVDLDYAQAVVDALESKNEDFFEGKWQGLKLENIFQEEDSLRVQGVESDQSSSDSVGAIVHIEGGLTHKPRPCTGLSSYLEIRQVMTELANMDNVSTVVMMLDTPGGMAYQCFETARAIREVMDETGTKLVAYVDGVYGANSAGYALASVAHEVISNPDAEIGSIGVVRTIINDLPKEIAEGSQVRFITYGKKKRPFNEDGTLTEAFFDEAETRVQELGVQFDAHVASYRALSEEEVKSLEADSFPALKALDLGLIDQVMERGEFMSYLNTLLKDKETEKLTDKANAEQLEALQSQMTEMASQLEAQVQMNKELSAEKDEMATLVKGVLAEREQEAKDELEASLEEYSFISDKAGMTAILFKNAEEDRKVILEAFASAKVEEDKAEDIDLPDEMTSKVSEDMEEADDEASEEFSGNLSYIALAAKKFQTQKGE